MNTNEYYIVPVEDVTILMNSELVEYQPTLVGDDKTHFVCKTFRNVVGEATMVNYPKYTNKEVRAYIASITTNND